MTLKVRYEDFTTVTRSRTFAVPVYDGASIAACARDLLRRTEAPKRPVRLLGVTASNLVRERVAAALAVRAFVGSVTMRRVLASRAIYSRHE